MDAQDIANVLDEMKGNPFTKSLTFRKRGGFLVASLYVVRDNVEQGYEIPIQLENSRDNSNWFKMLLLGVKVINA
jgi:hypothetical protein